MRNTAQYNTGCISYTQSNQILVVPSVIDDVSGFAFVANLELKGT